MIVADGHSKNFLPKYKNTWDAAKHLYKENGVRGMYRGCYFHLFNGVAWASYFTIYNSAKNRYKEYE